MIRRRTVRIVGMCLAAMTLVVSITVFQPACERPPLHTPPSHGLEFDGIDDFVSASAVAAITRDGSYTFMAWLHPTADDSVGKGRQIFQDSKSATDRNGMTVNNGTVRFGYYDGSSYVRASGEIILNSWTHAVGVNDSGAVTLYLNGILQTGTLNPYSHVEDGFYLGKNTLSEDGNVPFEGRISEVRVYAWALSAEEVQAVYENQDITAGLVAYWRFDDGDGLIAYDSTANNNHGVLNGEPVWFGGGV